MLSIQLFQDFPWDCSITYFLSSVNIFTRTYAYPDWDRGIITVFHFAELPFRGWPKPMRVPTIVNLWWFCLPSRIKQEPVKIPYPDSEVKLTDTLALFERSSHILLPPTARSAPKCILAKLLHRPSYLSPTRVFTCRFRMPFLHRRVPLHPVPMAQKNRHWRRVLNRLLQWRF